jgi:predicted dehydrogenase
MLQNKDKDVLQVAVIGCGAMGQNHLRVYSRMKGVEIAAVVDTDIERAQNFAELYGCEALNSISALPKTIQAASVTAPSSTHAEIGCSLLDRGIHCLIEKPLALNEQDCLDLISKSEANGCKLLVGHIERFNPAVRQLSELLSDSAKIYAIDAKRMSALSSRITDVDVVMDLMIHDLDIVLMAAGSPVVGIQANGVATTPSSGFDYVTALLTFKSGAMATVTASRITENRIRELVITSNIGCITLDYSTQELLVHQQNRTREVPSDGSCFFDLSVDRVLVRSSEPLMLELEHFVDSIVNELQPLITGQDSLDALRVVWKIQQEVSKHLG